MQLKSFVRGRVLSGEVMTEPPLFGRTINRRTLPVVAHLHRRRLDPWSSAKRSESGRTDLIKFFATLGPLSAELV